MSGFGFLPAAGMLPLLVEMAVKVTLVMLVAGLAAALLRHASAALRHLVWCVGIISLFAMPLLSALLPAWQWAALPGTRIVSAALPASGAAPEATAALSRNAVGEHAESAAADLPDGTWAADAAISIVIGGVLVGLLWLASGFWGVARMGRRAEIVRDAGWLHSAQQAAERLGLRRPVLLLRSGKAQMPATWGLVWPSVIVPAAAEEWPEDRRRAVLAHELAHVKRFDCLTQALAQLACILLWWHPAIWYAARRLRIERERACDDLVLTAGARPSDYATHLLEIARTQRAWRLAAPALVSMAKPSQLESRLLSVLDEARSRTAPSLRATVLILLAAIVVVAPLSATRPRDASNESRNTSATAAPRPNADLAAPAEAVSAAHPAAQDSPSSMAASEAAPTAPSLAPSPALEDLVALQSAGVDASYIRELRQAGYEGLSARQLADLKGSGVTGTYIAEMNSAGFGRLTPEDLVALSSVGIRTDYVEELSREGIAGLSLQQIVRLRGAGVTGKYVAEMKKLGLRPLGADTLAELHAVGVTPAVVRELAAEGYGPLTPEQLVRLRTEAQD